MKKNSKFLLPLMCTLLVFALAGCSDGSSGSSSGSGDSAKNVSGLENNAEIIGKIDGESYNILLNASKGTWTTAEDTEGESLSGNFFYYDGVLMLEVTASNGETLTEKKYLKGEITEELLKSSSSQEITFEGITFEGITESQYTSAKTEFNNSNSQDDDKPEITEYAISLKPGDDRTFPSISGAVEAMSNADTDYTIYISGTLTGCQTIPVTSNAKSITLEGLNFGVIDGNGEGTTLTISTTIPVTIKNLTITGGKNEAENTGLGGGIFADADTSVTLADGAVIKGNSAYQGGGVYLKGKLFMYSSAVIGDGTKTETATDLAYANNAYNGGGIFATSTSSIYLGYSSEETTSALSGGVCYNYTSKMDDKMSGTIYTDGIFLMNSGNIAYNYGSGLALNNGKSLKREMSGGSIFCNKTTVKGGGIRLGYEPRFTLSGGVISDNTAADGGGVAMANNGLVFTMTGGTISNNTATVRGGGVYCGEAYTSSFKMTGGSIFSNKAPTNMGASLYKNSAGISVTGKDSNGSTVNISDTYEEDIILVN